MSIELRSDHKRRLRRKSWQRAAARRPIADPRQPIAQAAPRDRLPRWAPLLALLGLALMVLALFDIETGPTDRVGTSTTMRAEATGEPLPEAGAPDMSTSETSAAERLAADTAEPGVRPDREPAQASALSERAPPMQGAPASAASSASDDAADAPSPYQLTLRRSPLAANARAEFAQRVAASREQRAAQARDVWRYDHSMRATGTLVTPPAAAFSLQDMTAPQSGMQQDAFDNAADGPGPEAFSRAVGAAPASASVGGIDVGSSESFESVTSGVLADAARHDDAPRTVLGIRDFGILSPSDAVPGSRAAQAVAEAAPLPRPRPEIAVPAADAAILVALPKPRPEGPPAVIAADAIAADAALAALPRPRPELGQMAFAPTLPAVADLDAPKGVAEPLALPRPRPDISTRLAAVEPSLALPRPRPQVAQVAAIVLAALPRPRPDVTTEFARAEAVAYAPAASPPALPRSRPAPPAVDVAALAPATRIAAPPAPARARTAAAPAPRAVAEATAQPIPLWNPNMPARGPVMTQAARRQESTRPASGVPTPSASAYAAVPDAGSSLPDALSDLRSPDAIAIAAPGGVVLPSTLLPSAAGGTGTAVSLDRVPVTAAALPYSHGVPRHMVDACLAKLQPAIARYGALRVHARSGGALQSLTDGGRLAPLAVRIVYALPGGGFEARSTVLTCRMAGGGVLGVS